MLYNCKNLRVFKLFLAILIGIGFLTIPSYAVWAVSAIGVPYPTIVAVGSPTTVYIRHAIAVSSCNLFVGTQNVGMMTLVPADGSPGQATFTHTFNSSGNVHAECLDTAGATQVGGTLFISVLNNGGWLNWSPGGTTHYNSVSFADQSRGWLVGTGGTTRSSTDGGRNWTTQTSGTTATLNDVRFVSSVRGWAVGSGGAIQFTDNGGTTWSAQASGTMNTLRSISMAPGSNNVGWAVGDLGTVRYTNNAGALWMGQTSGVSGTKLYSVSAVDIGTAWAVGDYGTIIKNSGGEEWATQTSGVTTALYGVHFVNNQVGWAVGLGGIIRKTTNGGTTWTGQASGTSVTLKDVFFVNANIGWVVGNGGLVLKTINGGTTWTPQPTPQTGNILNAISVVNGTAAWAVGANGTLLSLDAIAPTTPGSFTRTTGDDDNTPTFTWTASTDSGSGLSGYQILFDAEVFIPISNVLTYTVTSPMVNGMHTASLVAMDVADNVSELATIAFTIAAPVPAPPDTVAPSIPTGVIRASAETDRTPTFTWNAATDNVSVTSYEVQLTRFDGGESATFIVPVTNIGNVLNYTIPDESALTPGLTHEFRVRAVDAAGNRSGLSQKSPFAIVADTTPPSAPGNLTRTTADTVVTPTFIWTAATDASGVAGYEAQIDMDPYQAIDNVLTWTISEGSPLALGAHTVRIRAIDASPTRNVGAPVEITFAIVAVSSGGGDGGGTPSGGGTPGGGGTPSSGGGTTTGGGGGSGTTIGGGGGTTTTGGGTSGGGTFAVGAGVSRPPFTLVKMQADAEVIVRGDIALLLPTLGLTDAMRCQMDPIAAARKVEQVFSTVTDPTMHAAFNHFTSCGTITALHLGAGERLGVINSYKSAFGRLPSTAAHWFDVIKLANGRFPGETSASSEAAAKVRFKTIYRRETNMIQQNDKAAVIVMAYGLRPLPRNVASEAAAISIYKKIFGRTPSTAVEWDALRAIAYSGATR